MEIKATSTRSPNVSLSKAKVVLINAKELEKIKLGGESLSSPISEQCRCCLGLYSRKSYILCMPKSITMTKAKSGLSKDHPYESDADMTDEEIIEGLMEITALSRSDILKDERAYE